MFAFFDDTPRDITGLELIPAPASNGLGFPPSGLFLAGVAGFLLIAYLAYRWIVVPKSQPSPEDRAVRSLDRLKALQLIAKNKSEAHFTLLSRIARRYIDRHFQMSSRRQTTAEFLDAAGRNPSLNPHLEFLTAFLEACDVAKFAPPASVPKMGRQLEGDLRAWLSVREPSPPAAPSSRAAAPSPTQNPPGS